MSEVISLAASRALKNGDSLQWTTRDALAEVVRAIDAKEMNPGQVVITTVETLKDGTDINVICAGVNHLEAIGIVHSAINVLTADE